MAALGRRAFGRHCLTPLTWTRVAGQTLHGAQKRATTSLLCRVTTASNGGGLEETYVETKNGVQEPECRTNLTQCLLEKQRTPVAQGSLERERVVHSLVDMGFSDVHIHGLLSVQPRNHPQQLLDIISELLLLGLNPEPVYVALKKNPQLLKLPIMQMRKRSSYLRKLGLGEGTRRCNAIYGAEESELGSV
ncbi:hypothetical protein MC885_020045 [Smutsia gigantea]|nr:hypothetical protein MC885_020045 [Smutsia gigantea]